MDKNVDTYDYLFKIVLVGDLGVGKTSIVRRFKEDRFINEYKTTIGVDFTVQTVEIGKRRIKLQIWDTSGQERFKSITTTYFRNAHGSIVVYDITNKPSLQHAEKWLDDVRQYSGYTTTNLLVGNKLDLEDYREVSLPEAEAFAGSHGMMGVVETSAKDNVEIDEAFYKIAKELLNWNGETSLQQDSITLHNTLPADTSYWNCCSYT